MSEVGNNKAVQYLSSDRISNLPCKVIENILMRLSLPEAARTSILSKVWRHRWANIPQLVFDDTFAGISWDAMLSINYELVMKRVYEVLLRHSGPLHKFVLFISGLRSCPEIDQLILFLSKKDIQEFILLISCTGQHYYKLHSCLFSCLQLRCLTLESCIFKPPPSFQGFSKLISLVFRGVGFDAGSLKNFISNCPLLESLTLFCCSGISCLEFNAPNLKSFRYVCIYRSFCFKSTPLLEKVSIFSHSGPQSRGPKISCEVFNCLPAVESFAIDDYFLKNLAVPDVSMRLQATLNHLKFLDMIDLGFADMEEVSCALFLLRSPPNLRNLTIEVFHCKNASMNSSLQHLESDDHMDFSLDQLRKVELQCFSGTRPEVELVKLLLAKSSALKTMLVEFCFPMVANEKLKILEDLIRFKRASVEAEIICK